MIETFEQVYQRRKAAGEYDLANFEERARANRIYCDNGAGGRGLKAALDDLLSRRAQEHATLRRQGTSGG